MATATSPATSRHRARSSPGTAFAAAFADRRRAHRGDLRLHHHRRAQAGPAQAPAHRARPAEAAPGRWRDHVLVRRQPQPGAGRHGDGVAVCAARRRSRRGSRRRGSTRSRPGCRSPPGWPATRTDLAAYIDHRLLVRIATAENQALTIGPHGLLHHPGITQLPYRGRLRRGDTGRLRRDRAGRLDGACADRQPGRLLPNAGRARQPARRPRRERHADQPDPDDSAGTSAGRRLRRGGQAARRGEIGDQRRRRRRPARSPSPAWRCAARSTRVSPYTCPTHLFLAVPAGAPAT